MFSRNTLMCNVLSFRPLWLVNERTLSTRNKSSKCSVNKSRSIDLSSLVCNHSNHWKISACPLKYSSSVLDIYMNKTPDSMVEMHNTMLVNCRWKMYATNVCTWMPEFRKMPSGGKWDRLGSLAPPPPPPLSYIFVIIWLSSSPSQFRATINFILFACLFWSYRPHHVITDRASSIDTWQLTPPSFARNCRISMH